MNIFEKAKAIQSETIANRRYIHENPEIGLDVPNTKAFVMDKLREYGIEPKECGHGVTATIGNGGKVILLRADMDALPMKEESGLPFASKNDYAHTCGHDFHTAMLLSAAKLLKEQEDELQGTVKLMFQPAEETFQGSEDMIAAGILENPKVDAALAYHVSAGQMPVGIFMYNYTGTMMFSVDGFEIIVHGKGAHGAYPHNGVDPINIGVHIHLALQELIARESDPAKACVLTVGEFKAGSAPNIIPETATLRGTIRTNDPEAKALLVKRVKEVAEKTAEVYNGTAEVIFKESAPPLICNPTFTTKIASYMQELQIPGMMPYPGITASASEDFAVVAEKVPATFMYLSAGYTDARGAYTAHNPKAQFNEDVCPIGTACFVHCAKRWLEENK